MNPFLSYTNMKDKYPLQKLYLRIQVDLITPKKLHFLTNTQIPQPMLG